MSRASTQVPLTGLFLAATYGSKTCLTSQGEHALIRPWLWTLASDVGSYKIDVRYILISNNIIITMKSENLALVLPLHHVALEQP
jgi:hypothetical protein